MTHMATNKITRDVVGASFELRGDGQFVDDDGRNVEYKRMVTITGGKPTKSGAYQISPSRFLAILREVTKDKEVLAKLEELAKIV